MPSVYRFSTNTNATGTNITSLNNTGVYTFSFWAKGPSGIAGDVFRQASTANSARDGYAILFSGDDLTVRHFTATTTTTYIAVGGRPHRDNIWKHYAITYDLSAVRGYVNGSLIQRTAAATSPTSNALCSTTMLPGSNGTYVGNLFDLQLIFGTAMESQDIRLLMNPTYTHPNLKARYFGREFVGVGSNSTLRDESGNNNNLTTPATTGRLDIAEEPPIRPTFA